MDMAAFCATFPTGNTNGWMLWHYWTDDDLDHVLTPNYFDAAVWRVQIGDWIAVNAATDTALLVVRSIDNIGPHVRVERIGGS
jgi:hypothetical protein